MMTTNLIMSYPMLWLKWQRAIFGSWFDLWTNTTPQVANGAEQTINTQEQLVNTFWDMGEKTLNNTFQAQKLFWDNYFSLLGMQQKQMKNQVQQMTAKLEEFPTSAGLEQFPASVNVSQ